MNNQFGSYGSYPFSIPNYSNNFSQQYGGQPQQTPYNPMQQTPQPSGNYFYVNGIEGAKAFLVPANSTAILFDSDSNTLYIKSANQQGQAVLKQFEYHEKTPQQTQQRTNEVNMDNYITREEFEEFKAKMRVKPNAQAKEVSKNV